LTYAPFYLRPPFHGRNYGVKQGLGVYCELQFGSLRAPAYDCCYQINRCILSPSGTLLARNSSIVAEPSCGVNVLKTNSMSSPTPPRGSTSNPPSPALNQVITFYQQQQGAAKTTTPAICGRMAQLVEARDVKRSTALSICTQTANYRSSDLSSQSCYWLRALEARREVHVCLNVFLSFLYLFLFSITVNFWFCVLSLIG